MASFIVGAILLGIAILGNIFFNRAEDLSARHPPGGFFPAIASIQSLPGECLGLPSVGHV
jgi:hypothetical protein